MTDALLADVYRERNLLALGFAALADLHRAAGAPWDVYVADDPAEPGWPVLYVGTPSGQMSWHLPKALLDEVVPGWRDRFWTETAAWDGHTTGEKYDRLTELIRGYMGDATHD
jgi:hypothetical protein